MIHLGDITKINGYQVPIVDVVTGGSPCQDLSVAGKRVGLAGERSGLFMEQIRIIKEMRENDKACGRTNESVRPRYMVWENVPGAFSSNNGEDFRAVLEETAKVAEGNACIPRFENGKWPSAGCIMGDGWSIAWRVHDAQFWGVPQRRKRIALVADFGGETAPEILFERKGVSGDIEESGTERESVAPDSKASIGNAISFQKRAGKPGGGKGILIQNEHTGALSTLNNQSVYFGMSPYGSNSMKSSNPNSGIYKAETSRTLDLNGGSPACNQGGMMIVEPNVILLEPRSQDGVHRLHDDGICPSLNTMQGGQRQPCVCTGFNAYNQADTGDVTFNPIVRRLTPLECERLQGFPDNWTNIGEWTDSKGKLHKDADSPRYKALGNSIALPFWRWMAKRMVAFLPNNSTMASLFDGIGGFPLAYSDAGCYPIWASEIEEFPMAVTKIHFGKENET